MIQEPPPASRRRLLGQTAIALAAASAAAVLVVLPAERGIDLTGFGRLTGLVRLAKPQTARVEIAPDASAAKVSSTAAGPFLTDTLEIKLAAGGAETSEVERKVRMEAGQTLVYAWTSDGSVYADFHGETLPTPKVSVVSYRVTDPDKGSNPRAASGGLAAPMAGFHGWYFSNLEDRPVTIRVRIAGFYDRRPYPPPN